ncbi:hypothetical protein ACOMHN_011626 [Nucella lapillus]
MSKKEAATRSRYVSNCKAKPRGEGGAASRAAGVQAMLNSHVHNTAPRHVLRPLHKGGSAHLQARDYKPPLHRTCPSRVKGGGQRKQSTTAWHV